MRDEKHRRLFSIGVQEAQDLALDLAKRWVYQNWHSYRNSGEKEAMYEKYDSIKVKLWPV